MRVHVGSDHAGFELKRHLVAVLGAAGHDVVDHGPHAFDPEDDYPPYCLAAATAVAGEPGTLGVVVGGSGNGEQIAANKVPGVRAALAWSRETAVLGRRHNDAQVVAVGARMHAPEEATSFVEAFLAEPFSGEERHVRRLRLLAAYEADHVVPPGAPGTDG